VPVVGFGGSYGGMVRRPDSPALAWTRFDVIRLLQLTGLLTPTAFEICICVCVYMCLSAFRGMNGQIAAWFKIKFPTLINGVIAASAPIWSFLGMDPAYDDSAYMVPTQQFST